MFILPSSRPVVDFSKTITKQYSFLLTPPSRHINNTLVYMFYSILNRTSANQKNLMITPQKHQSRELFTAKYFLYHQKRQEKSRKPLHEIFTKPQYCRAAGNSKSMPPYSAAPSFSSPRSGLTKWQPYCQLPP